MPPFQRVEQNRAGASAVGILIPPGERTVVIVRPRALAWDLLPARIENGVRSFCQFGRDEAARVARLLQQHLADAANAGSDSLAILSDPAAQSFHVGVQAGDFYWIACPRTPGQLYQPLQFSSAVEAETAALHLGKFVCPGRDANQEYYFNTQLFNRS